MSQGARVYVTTDGKTFSLKHQGEDGSSLMAAKMLSATEHWAGGSSKVCNRRNHRCGGDQCGGVFLDRPSCALLVTPKAGASSPRYMTVAWSLQTVT